MFKKISIEGFRVLKKIEIDDFKQFNLIVGKNNCGKTSILEALYQSINPGNASLLGKVNNWKNLNPFNPDSWKTLFYKLDINTHIELKSEFFKPSETREIKIEPILEIGSLETSLDIEYETSKETYIKDSSSTLSPTISGLQLQFEITVDKRKRLGPYLSTIITNKNIPQPTKNGMLFDPYIIENDPKYECTTNGRFIHPLNIQQGLGLRFSKIAIKKQKGFIIDILKKLDPNLTDLELVGDTIYADLGYKELAPIRILGDGLLKILAINNDIAITEGGSILIDEIENGLHHTSQKLLWDSIFKTAKQFNVQLIATTHSYECVKSFLDSYMAQESKNDDLRLFRIERRRDNEYKVIKYNSKELEIAIAKDWEIR